MAFENDSLRDLYTARQYCTSESMRAVITEVIKAREGATVTRWFVPHDLSLHDVRSERGVVCPKTGRFYPSYGDYDGGTDHFATKAEARAEMKKRIKGKISELQGEIEDLELRLEDFGPSKPTSR